MYFNSSFSYEKSNEVAPSTEAISRSPFPNSRKIYVPGALHNIQVAMREISLTDTKISGNIFTKILR
jgi:phosphomethylpyrimidine synthase